MHKHNEEKMNNNIDLIYASLREKIEHAGFLLEGEQKPHFQNAREKELKFIHPELEEKFSLCGIKNRAKKFYLKPLSDDTESEIGLTTGKTSPLFDSSNFAMPNAIDTYKNNELNAWVNKLDDNALDRLLESIKSYLNLTLEDVISTFSYEILSSLNTSPEERLERLKCAPKKPQKIAVKTLVYKRNPDVVAEVLNRAKGKCESCSNNAPFLRKKDLSPYLEVHHLDPLSNGGDDTIENAIALCPNCHREKHFG